VIFGDLLYLLLLLYSLNQIIFFQLSFLASSIQEKDLWQMMV